jgi:WD40 repeat protein
LRGHQYEVWDVEFSSDGTRLVTASRDGTARIWDTATWQQLLVLGDYDPQGSTMLETVAISRDGMRIAANGSEGARVWEVRRTD